MQLSLGRLQVARSPFPALVDVPRTVELEILAFAATPAGARALGDLLDMPSHASDELAEQVLRALARGDLEYEAWSPTPGWGSVLASPRPLAQLARDEPREIPLHAVILELIDTQDRPVSGAAYHLVDPDGRTHRGRLDDEGKAEIRDVRSPGDCKVSFPDFDHEAWVYFSAHPL